MAGCKRPAETAAKTETKEEARTPTNRIDVPEAVRQNLGITFAKVERRRVAATLRLPGRFELLPTGRREYRVGLAGRFEPLVKQFDKVQVGTPLFRLDSAEWHKIRLSLEEGHAAVEKAQAAVELAKHARAEGEQVVKFLEARVKALAELDVKRAEVDAELTAKRAALPRLDAEIKARRIDLDEAKHHLPIAISAAASALGVTPAHLTEVVEEDRDGHTMPRWRTIHTVEVVATQAGVVDSLPVSAGAYVEAGATVVTTVDPQALRFAAVALQNDLGRLKDGQGATIAPPAGTGLGAGAAITGKLSVGVVHNAEQRTIDVYVTPEKPAAWASPGLAAQVEVVTSTSGEEELAIPLASVVRDELHQIFFRRDPKAPDKVIRVEADLGTNDGKWVVVNSGLADGDEVVLEGAYELKLAGGGKPTGGHFHADGTWHPDHK
jgi:multidrug efflux pump subunit AcrA (membrane-fusion protein)